MSTDAPQSYPLAWPTGKPRTDWRRRVRGGFEAGRKLITIQAAAAKLADEVGRLGAIYPILSTNLEVRLDGRPRGGQAQPADPGACLYFQREGKPYALACDTYDRVEQNIAAIANHIDATRRIERYGVATAEEMLSAFQALPNPDRPKPWRDVLGALSSPAEVASAFRRLSAERHPDRPGGSHDAMAELTSARDAALKELQQ